MAYRVEITARALRDLTSIYQRIEAETSELAARWFDGMERAITSLEERPDRAPVTPEDRRSRHLLYGKKPNVYRIIYAVRERSLTVSVLHIRPPGRAPIMRR